MHHILTFLPLDELLSLNTNSRTTPLSLDEFHHWSATCGKIRNKLWPSGFRDLGLLLAIAFEIEDLYTTFKLKYRPLGSNFYFLAM